MQNLTEIFNKESLAIKSFPFFFIFAVIINLIMLTTFSISIDDEYSAFRTDHSMWIGQGRWTLYLLQSFILPQVTIPYFPHLIFIFFLTASYLCILRAHHLSVDLYAYLLFPFFCAFPTWGFIAEFYANIPGVGLALFLVSMAIYLFRWVIMERIIQGRMHASSFFCTIIVQTLIVAIAIGVYQSFLFAFFSMGLGVIVYRHIKQGLDLIKMGQCLLALIVLSIMSTVVYFIINHIFLSAFNTKIVYINGFYQPDVLFNDPLGVIATSLSQIRKVYSSSSLYGTSFVSIGILMFLGIYAVLSDKQMIKRMSDKAITLTLVLLLALSPFALNFFSAGFMPYRTLMAVPYVVWFFALLALMNSQNIIKVLVMVFIVTGIFQIIYANSLHAASRQLKQTHDEMLANSIYQRIVEVHPDFNRDHIYPIVFYGAKYVQLPYPNVSSTTMSGSFFSWDNGNSDRIVLFMKLLGFNNLAKEPMSENFEPYFKEMPRWPASGSVKVIDGITLVKLSDKK